MKKIVHILSEHITWHIQKGLRGFFLLALLPLLLLASVYYRYNVNPGIYHGASLTGMNHALLFYTVPFFTAVFFAGMAAGTFSFFAKTEFWIICFLSLLVLFINDFIVVFSVKSFPVETRHYLSQVFFHLKAALFYVLIPLLCWWLWYRKKNPEYSRFGFSSKNFKAKPYFLMLLMMVPLIVAASFRQSFQWDYPRYIPGAAEHYWNVSPLLTVSGFESAYSLQFIGLEWFFRGFMVLALSKFLGPAAVWPMVSVYVFLHFGKPMGETIGSLFGSYILGTISLHTKSITGGIIIHLGIALLMELMAWVV
ncbi:MAG: type II CAAX prenyl endopeptidase Rce1 family protein [Bacteroidota bacterium]